MAGNQRVGRDAAKKALKEFYNTPLWELEEELGEIVEEETDRGSVILLATCVEDLLAAAISRNFVDLSNDEQSRLFGPDAPLGTFSAKIRVAHALGIIKREQMVMCDVLREMRNACAHSRRAISFKNKALRDMLGVAMSYVFEEDFVTNLEDMHRTTPIMLKVYFMWVCGWLSRYIRTGSENEATELIQRLLNEATGELQKAAASQKKLRSRSQKGRPQNHKAKRPPRPPRSSPA